MPQEIKQASAPEIRPVAEEAPPPRSRRRFVLPIVAVVVLLGLVWAAKQWSYSRGHESTDDAAVDGHLIPVLAKVSGYIQAVNVQDNAHVAADSLLVQIDPSEYRVRLAQAEADLAAAQATAGTGPTTGQAEAQVQTAAGQREALSAQIDAAKANAQKAHSDLQRMQQLADQQIVSRQQLDAAQAAVQAADANVLALQRQAAAAGASVTNAQAGVRLADARLQAARATVENAKLQLDYTSVRAPAAGIVSRKQAEIGQLVQAGQPLLTIVADTGVFVTANFKETQLSNIRPGQSVDVDVDTYGGATARGVVESIAAATGSKFALLPPDNATGNFTKVVQRVPVRVRITQGLGANRPLRPGMSVNVHVATK
ncbi:MAG TPA: HlyD family secretion protein [Gemmatimonadaceae bacterium]|nr:HlyD family secretion protein [Gemmatimonadaceae bacterium]